MRAEAHIRTVQSTLNRWILEGGYRIWNVTDDEGFSYTYAEQTMPFPSELAATIGDALQCLRNSLDNLAFTLARTQRYPRVLLGEEEEGVSFPIQDEAISRETHAISLMSDSAKDAIIDLAPNPERKPLEVDLLWLLNETAHRDEHRALRLMATARVKSVLVDGAPFPMEASPPKQDFGVCTEPVLVYTWNLAADIPGAVTVEFKPAFAGPPVEVANLSFMVMLWKWHDHIRDEVFPRLERHLGAEEV